MLLIDDDLQEARERAEPFVEVARYMTWMGASDESEEVMVDDIYGHL